MISLTPSHIIEYLYCPRFTYFEYVLGIQQYEERHYKVQKGRNIHELKMVRNKEYLRKRIGAVEKYSEQYLTNGSLRGKIDEVLLLSDGSMAPLDYKYAQYKEKIYDTYKTQLFCYAVLIEENFQKEVNKGFIVYVRSANKLKEIPIRKSDKDKIKIVIEQVSKVISINFYPKSTRYKKRCLTCTYRNICTK
jgi:CRISPR-associated exonuclease Cas4